MFYACTKNQRICALNSKPSRTLTGRSDSTAIRFCTFPWEALAINDEHIVSLTRPCVYPGRIGLVIIVSAGITDDEWTEILPMWPPSYEFPANLRLLKATGVGPQRVIYWHFEGRESQTDLNGEGERIPVPMVQMTLGGVSCSSIFTRSYWERCLRQG